MEKKTYKFPVCRSFNRYFDEFGNICMKDVVVLVEFDMGPCELAFYSTSLSKIDNKANLIQCHDTSLSFFNKGSSFDSNLAVVEDSNLKPCYELAFYSTSLSKAHITLSKIETTEWQPYEEEIPSSFFNFENLLVGSGWYVVLGGKPGRMKRAAIECKLFWKIKLKKPFHDKGFISKYISHYRSFIVYILLDVSNLIILFAQYFCFEKERVIVSKKTPFEMSLRRTMYYGALISKDKLVRKPILSRFTLLFKYLFLNILGKGSENLFSLFPAKGIVEREFLNVKEFDNYFICRRDPLSIMKQKIKRVLKIVGHFYLKGIYGIRISKLDYMVKVKNRCGVKLSYFKLYYFNGMIGKIVERPLFDEAVLYSCYSESKVYSYPYTKFHSFRTAGKLYGFGKTYKPEKMIQNSSIHKQDKYWTRSSARGKKKY